MIFSDEELKVILAALTALEQLGRKGHRNKVISDIIEEAAMIKRRIVLYLKSKYN